ncbi:aspartate kinase [Reichenbachiella carrageenanivorans]|uniref:Aspartokinase n=1 Tax=Reichenbachiella carrageenanivorans TaxID=2979869 RepID=A0ABY6D1K6_9BACT|nr:aspartate kinase [Reichenbachiella carrageenanivorans]UXX80036.1 aspartate kinase [Reichenbachiella carrageenanivorans]
MKVFKFGGASVKDAPSVKNVAEVIKQFCNEELVVIVSAMGKTTNALEELVQLFFDKGDWQGQLQVIKNFHFDISNGLFEKDHQVFERLETIFEGIAKYLSFAESKPYMEVYSEMVSQGELLSTRIIRNYLNENIHKTIWIDARTYVKTDYNYIDARVDWDMTKRNISEKIPAFAKDAIVITQGFIGSNGEGKTTTLGREGSDFSAAIFATGLSAESVTVWKDVPGVMTADPRKMPDAVIIPKLSYTDASEMTYYGASIIHPRTIKPLAQNGIKLYVRPFNAPEELGTVIGDEGTGMHPASFILKTKQVFIDFKVTDFTFIDEKKLSMIFNALDQLNIKINLMQNSAVSFSICIDKKFDKVEHLVQRLSDTFNIEMRDNLEMLTVKGYDQEALDKIYDRKEILLEQKSKDVYHLLYVPEKKHKELSESA